MTITLTPEQERIIQAQIASGRFRSVDEVLDQVLSFLKPQASEVPEQDERAQAAAERIRTLRRGVRLDRPSGMSLREYAHIGHKY